MPILHAIVAVSENNVISNHGKLPWHLPDEYRWFKHKTIGSTLIMGRKTREAIGRALPRRVNLVLSRSRLTMEDTQSFTSEAELLKTLAPDQVAWVVGGAEIYRLFLPRCTLLYLSRIKRVVSGDIYFPAYEESFALDQVVHENADFRIERWIHRAHVGPKLDPEVWP